MNESLTLFAGDAVRIIQAGGVYVNGSRVVETQLLMSPEEHILSNNLTLLRIGQFAFSFFWFVSYVVANQWDGIVTF